MLINSRTSITSFSKKTPPDYEYCTKVEIERWKRDLDKEKQGEKEFEGFYGIGIYEIKEGE